MLDFKLHNLSLILGHESEVYLFHGISKRTFGSFWQPFTLKFPESKTYEGLGV